jgi:hypothetical protein
MSDVHITLNPAALEIIERTTGVSADDMRAAVESAPDFSMADRLSASELTIIATALDFMAEHSTLEDRLPILSPFTSDHSAAPLRRIAARVRALRDSNRHDS